MEEEHEYISDIVYPEIYSTQRLSSSGDNFLIWKLKLDFILTNRKLYHLLNPPPPPEQPIPPRAYPIYMDSSVGFILQTLEDGLQAEFFNYPNAECILGIIFPRFTSLLKRCKFHKIKDYFDLRMVDGTPVSQHIFRMRAMAKELEYIGVKIPDDIHALILLNSLPEEWAEDVECLLREMGVHKEELSLDYVSHWLMNLMDVIKWRHFSNWKNNLKGNCYVCGKLGHYQSDCPDQASSDISNSPVCPFPQGQASLLRILYREFNSFLKLKCDCSNYSLWKDNLFQVLRQGGVDYIVDDSIHVDQTNFVLEAELQQSKWQEDDFICRHLILGTMDDDIFLSFHDYPTSKDLLEAVEACFGYASPARKLHLLQEYMCCRMREGSQIAGHTTKMETMVQKLTSCYDLQVPNEMQSVILLDSLPSTWENSLQTLKLNIRKKDDLRIKFVKRGVLEIGRIRDLFPGQDAAGDSHDCCCINNRNRAFRRNCYSCRRPGHQQANCPEF